MWTIIYLVCAWMRQKYDYYLPAVSRGSTYEARHRKALDVIKEEHTMPAERRRNKREVPFTHDEKRIAGCLLQCVYRKVKAVDGYGFPTLEGLVSLYSDGVNERGYFMAVLDASRECLMKNHDKFSRTVPMDNGLNCDISFDIFECISDRIGEYCGTSGL
ncbi:general odorant-binding protein 70 isoform X2 [Colias croceus]|uniref:general odorant-binding protein 70 isoform X2 n=1 Tax=Colias crocea TaxID=72248 RepID=UPI001E2808B1|nr:general odorant-binding protein 70 isoform X2 [Colias croceus]